jgi:hypothetical protein
MLARSIRCPSDRIKHRLSKVLDIRWTWLPFWRACQLTVFFFFSRVRTGDRTETHVYLFSPASLLCVRNDGAVGLAWSISVRSNGAGWDKTGLCLDAERDENPHPSWVHVRRYGFSSNAELSKALYYKPEGRGLDTRWGEFLNLANLSGRTRSWGLLSL